MFWVGGVMFYEISGQGQCQVAACRIAHHDNVAAFEPQVHEVHIRGKRVKQSSGELVGHWEWRTGAQPIFDSKASTYRWASFNNASWHHQQPAIWPGGAADVGSAVEEEDDLFIWVGRITDKSVFVFVDPVSRDVDGYNLQCICTGFDASEDEILGNSGDPNSVEFFVVRKRKMAGGSIISHSAR